MRDEENKTRALSIFLLYIILSFAVVFFQTRAIEEGKSHPAEGIFSSSILPGQRAMSSIASGISSFISSFRPSKEMLEENYKLKKSVSKLKKENAVLKEALEENKKLKELLDFKEELDIEPLSFAQVVGREPDSWYQSVIIDRGNKDELAKNMVIINNEGLIGRIAVVSTSTSKVMLITDTISSVPAIIRETREAGIVYGTGNSCEMKYLSSEAKIKEGDTVITSGLGTIFPKGIVIGKIIRAYGSQDKLFQMAEVKPAVEFQSLENVMVILKYNPEEEIVQPPVEGN